MLDIILTWTVFALIAALALIYTVSYIRWRLRIKKMRMAPPADTRRRWIEYPNGEVKDLP